MTRMKSPVPATVPSQVEASVLNSRSIRLRWTISYSPERELIDGFFVGYRSFDTSTLLGASLGGAPGSASGNSAGTPLAPSLGKQPVERPTFTYKTIRLTNQQQQAHMAQDEHQNPNGQLADSAAPLLSPVSSVTKTVSAPTSAGGELNPNSNKQQQVVVVSNFEYVIGGLDRNTEYTILIQCFNKKGAGPTSDPVVFKTFMSGKWGPNAKKLCIAFMQICTCVCLVTQSLNLNNLN